MTRVVLCEDSLDIQKLIEEQLREHGIEVIGRCANASECERCITRLVPDVVLLDLGLADDTVPLITRLAAIAAVVVFSGFPREYKEQECLKAGAVAYVQKLAPAEELATAVQAAADSR